MDQPVPDAPEVFAAVAPQPRSVRLAPASTRFEAPDSHTTGFGLQTFDADTDSRERLPAALLESLRYVSARFALHDASAVPAPLAVTSALHGEGVTTVAMALSEVLAETFHRSVCSIDLSWTSSAKPRLATESGIYELLTGTMSIDQFLGDATKTIHLGPGRVPEKRVQAMARSHELEQLIDQLVRRTGMVVLDTPPLLVGSDALSVLRYSRSALLVVRHGVTTTAQVKAAVGELEAVPVVGVVMNRYRSKVPRRLRGLLS